MPLPFNPNHLKSSELAYEISIRGQDVPKTAEERRQLLRGLLTQESSNRSTSSISMDIDFAENFKQTSESVQNITEIVQTFVGSRKSSQYKTLIDRLSHVANRLRRMETNTEQEQKSKKELTTKLSMLEGVLEEKVTPQQDDIAEAPASTPIASPIRLPQVGVPKLVPVYKWNLQKFTGTENLVGFLEKLETLKVSRNCSDQDLFLSASDLFEGPAFTWWHNHFVRESFTSWADLVSALKETYLPVDYERNLWDKIRSTKQQFGETVWRACFAIYCKF
uniref:Uncharacterized protein LOC114329451 n=1 Tax=Diabrotica virgifera virgifera TaxID=50390 RepID=A0A6P7FEB9_DIAVI